MSKQSDAKKAQNYRKELNRCGNCKNFTRDVITRVYNEGRTNQVILEEDKNKRCLKGGFAVMVNSVCDAWEKKWESKNGK